MQLAKLAFYKGPGDITDRAIRWYTGSQYSHVELVIGDWWYSTSPRDMQVRKKLIIPNTGNWDYINVEIDHKHVSDLFDLTEGAGYDWAGILLSQTLPLNIHDKKRWFCSEWVATALKLHGSNKYSPGKLYNKIRGNNGVSY